MTTVAIVSLGRGQAMGEVRRVASWRQLFEAAGAEVVEIGVAPGRGPHLDGLGEVVRAVAPPERLAWSWPRLRESLRNLNPDVVMIVSTRAFAMPVLEGGYTVFLDQVDSLARSYADRAQLLEGAHRRLGYRVLAALHARVERRLRTIRVRRFAAGWSDARTLDAEWVPNLLDPKLAPVAGSTPDTDVLFFGTLRYPPNIDALERMAAFWPQLQARRPGTTALVAGSAPALRVQDLCRRYGWELVADFDALPAVAARARVAVAPLNRAAGIQNKVLDAIPVGLAQVVTPQALEGFPPDFALEGQGDDASFVAEIVRLLDDPSARQEQVTALTADAQARYSTTAWLPWAIALLSGASLP